MGFEISNKLNLTSYYSKKIFDPSGVGRAMTHPKLIADLEQLKLSHAERLNAAMVEINRLGGIGALTEKTRTTVVGIVEDLFEVLEQDDKEKEIPGAKNILYYQKDLTLNEVERVSATEVVLHLVNRNSTATTKNYQVNVTKDQLAVYSPDTKVEKSISSEKNNEKPRPSGIKK